MKSIHVNDKQVARNIAVILKHNPHKMEQLKKVREIKEPAHEIARKPRGARAVFVSWVNIHAHDILWMLEDMGVKVYEN
jgi:hypothetical protein